MAFYGTQCRTVAESVRGHWNINEKKEELSLEASTAYRSTTVKQAKVQGERATDTDPVSLPTETGHPHKCETNTPMLKGRVPTEKMVASIKYREHTSLTECRCRELGTVMTDRMKKYPVHCEATVTIRRFEKDKSDNEYYGRVPRLLPEQVLEQQVEDDHAREQLSDFHGKKGKPQE